MRSFRPRTSIKNTDAIEISIRIIPTGSAAYTQLQVIGKIVDLTDAVFIHSAKPAGTMKYIYASMATLEM